MQNSASPVGKIARLASRTVFRLAPWAYHHWYYSNYVWGTTSWMGIPILKSPSDMWNYQEILFQLKPSVVVEFGTYRGGSALFFASIMRQLCNSFHILTVDINPCEVTARNVQFLIMSSTDDRVSVEIRKVRDLFPGPMFAILDSDHSKDNVLREMISLRDLTHPGDYLIVEDSNINGHPVYGAFGPGPYEAINEYFHLHPDDYIHDYQREKKFGFTFATNGFLARR